MAGVGQPPASGSRYEACRRAGQRRARVEVGVGVGAGSWWMAAAERSAEGLVGPQGGRRSAVGGAGGRARGGDARRGTAGAGRVPPARHGQGGECVPAANVTRWALPEWGGVLMLPLTVVDGSRRFVRGRVGDVHPLSLSRWMLAPRRPPSCRLSPRGAAKRRHVAPLTRLASSRPAEHHVVRRWRATASAPAISATTARGRWSISRSEKRSRSYPRARNQRVLRSSRSRSARVRW